MPSTKQPNCQTSIFQISHEGESRRRRSKAAGESASLSHRLISVGSEKLQLLGSFVNCVWSFEAKIDRISFPQAFSWGFRGLRVDPIDFSRLALRLFGGNFLSFFPLRRSSWPEGGDVTRLWFAENGDVERELCESRRVGRPGIATPL